MDEDIDSVLPGSAHIYRKPTDFHLSHQFSMKNGYVIPKISTCELPKPSSYIRRKITPEIFRFQQLLSQEKLKKARYPTFEPDYVKYDKKCLSFRAYFKQNLQNDFNKTDTHIIRKVNIIYFLEDNTLTIMEPPVDNACYLQGRLVRRGLIKKPNSDSNWHWKDLNIGIDLEIYGNVYHICSCDNYTKQFLISQGIIVNEMESIPEDGTENLGYEVGGEGGFNDTQRIKISSADQKLRRFLQYDRKVLRFYAVWDDRQSECGDIKHYKIHYFLFDNTIEIFEIRQQFTTTSTSITNRLLSRIRLPKNFDEIIHPGINIGKVDFGKTEYYEPIDFIVGKTISIFGRPFLIYDCDRFTRTYFQDYLKIEQPDRINVEEKVSNPVPKIIPPHIGIGNPDDTIQSCLSIIPKPPKKNIMHYIENSNKILRYKSKLSSNIVEDEERKFVIQYHVADGKISVYENQIANSGYPGGYFLKNSHVPKSNDTFSNELVFYSPNDFIIGSSVNIFGRKFIITGADLAVYQYMKSNPEKFTDEAVTSVKQYLQREGILNDIDV